MIEVRWTVRASAGDVFAVLSNGWLYPSWVVGASRVRDVDDTWPEPGSRLHHSVGIWPLLLNDSTQVLACQRPTRLLLQARGWPAGEARVDLRIEPRGTSCVVTMTEDATHGPGRLVPAALRQAAIAPRNRESLRRLAYLAQGHAGALAR